MPKIIDQRPKTVLAVKMDDGSAELVNVVTLDTNKCGCRITGDGTLQNPLGIVYCVAHSAGYGLFAKWEQDQAVRKDSDGNPLS